MRSCSSATRRSSNTIVNKTSRWNLPLSRQCHSFVEYKVVCWQGRKKLLRSEVVISLPKTFSNRRTTSSSEIVATCSQIESANLSMHSTIERKGSNLLFKKEHLLVQIGLAR
jgi:hypothetical protein